MHAGSSQPQMIRPCDYGILTSGKIVATFQGGAERINSAVFSVHGRRVLASCADHTARIVEVESGKVLTPPYRSPHRSSCTPSSHPGASNGSFSPGDKGLYELALASASRRSPPGASFHVAWASSPYQSALVCIEQIASLGMQLAVLGPPHLIDCFIEVFGDMKFVMHDLGLGRCLGSGAQARLPHVDSDSFNLLPLLGPEPCPAARALRHC
jgi:hypothetical protein